MFGYIVLGLLVLSLLAIPLMKALQVGFYRLGYCSNFKELMVAIVALGIVLQIYLWFF